MLNYNTGDNNTGIDVTVRNAEGSLLLQKKTGANGNLKIGTETWKSGVYFVEVIQGGQRKVIKLVKL